MGMEGFAGADLDRLSNVVTGTSHSRLIPQDTVRRPKDDPAISRNVLCPSFSLLLPVPPAISLSLVRGTQERMRSDTQRFERSAFSFSFFSAAIMGRDNGEEFWVRGRLKPAFTRSSIENIKVGYIKLYF